MRGYRFESKQKQAKFSTPGKSTQKANFSRHDFFQALLFPVYRLRVLVCGCAGEKKKGEKKIVKKASREDIDSPRISSRVCILRHISRAVCVGLCTATGGSVGITSLESS